MIGKVMSYIVLIILTGLIFMLTGLYFVKYSILIPVTISMLILILGLAYIKKYYENE